MVYPLGGRRRAAEGKKRTWGDGTELEGIEDLEVDEPSNSRSSAASGSGIGLGRPSKKGKYRIKRGCADEIGDSLGKSAVPPRIEDKRKKSEGKGSVGKRKTRKTAGLIKHLGGVDKKKGKPSYYRADFSRWRYDLEPLYTSVGRQRIHSPRL